MTTSKKFGRLFENRALPIIIDEVKPMMVAGGQIPKAYTLQDYMRDLVKRANGFTEDGIVNTGSAKLRNFIKGHDLIGTLRGSPHWVRNENFYKRNAHA